MYKSKLVSTLSFLLLAIQGAAADPIYFDGTIENRGDLLGVRLVVDSQDPGASTLDIPQLWYAEEQIVATLDEDRLSLEFPFGIGQVDLDREGSGWMGQSGAVTVSLRPGEAPPFSKVELSLAAQERETRGTLYLPHGDGPFPAVIIIGGSGAGARDSWEYRSKAVYYARMGVAALIYDRLPYGEEFSDGSRPDFWTHAEDISAARDLLAARNDIAEDSIGLHGGSQGVWLSTIAQSEHGGFAFMVMTGVPAVSPGQQQMQVTVHGMRDDGLSEESIADAVAYTRLYFYVARTGEGWEVLQAAIEAGRDTDWMQYVDQPQVPEDLHWWGRHEAYEPRGNLTAIDIPILAMTGTEDWITPHEENLPLLEYYAQQAGNDRVLTMTISGADHRLERGPYTDDDGQWHWFEIAHEAREAIPAFLQGQVGLTIQN